MNETTLKRTLRTELRQYFMVIGVNSGKLGHTNYNANQWDYRGLREQTKGHSDMVILLPNGASHYVELKAGSKQSSEQKLFQASLDSLNHTYRIITPDNVHSYINSLIREYKEVLW